MNSREKKALIWFDEHGPAHLFGSGDPPLFVITGLAKKGLLKTTRPHVGFVSFELSDAGRDALKALDVLDKP